MDSLSWSEIGISSPFHTNGGEIEISVSVVEVRSLPRLLGLITELRGELTSSAKAQEEALATLGSEGIGPELAKRMNSLRSSALAETERRVEQRRTRGSSLDGPSFSVNGPTELPRICKRRNNAWLTTPPFPVLPLPLFGCVLQI